MIYFVMLLLLVCPRLQENMPRNLLCRVISCKFYEIKLSQNTWLCKGIFAILLAVMVVGRCQQIGIRRSFSSHSLQGGLGALEHLEKKGTETEQASTGNKASEATNGKQLICTLLSLDQFLSYHCHNIDSSLVLWGTSFPSLDGQNRQSPIASVQRTQSTLASYSAVPRGTNSTPTNANRAIQHNEHRVYKDKILCFSGEIWPPTNASDSNLSDNSP